MQSLAYVLIFIIELLLGLQDYFDLHASGTILETCYPARASGLNFARNLLKQI